DKATLFKLLVVGDAVFQNVLDTVIDEFGNEVKTLNLPEDEEGLKKIIIDTMNYITDNFFYKEAKERGGYKNMGEIKLDADSGDEDAKYLLSLYEAVWNAEEAAEEEVNNMSIDQLKDILPDVPSFLTPKLEAAKASLESSTEES
ncbi:hypothetical protein, partial [Thermovibrio sp.]